MNSVSASNMFLMAFVLSGLFTLSQVYWVKCQDYLILSWPGQGGIIRAVAVTPDGRYIASGNQDGTVKIWDLSDGNLIRVLSGHVHEVLCLTISSDGTKVISGSYYYDNTAKIWNISDGSLIHTLIGHVGFVTSVAITPDSLKVISGGGWDDSTIRIWDALNGTLTLTVPAHSFGINVLAVSPDGTKLVSGGNGDGTLQIWNLHDMSSIIVMHGHSPPVYGLRITRDGSKIVSGGHDTTIRVWNFDDGNMIRTITNNTYIIYGLDISPDGSEIISGSGDAMVKIWNLNDGTLIRTLTGHTSGVHGVAITSDGSKIVSVSGDETIKVWGFCAAGYIYNFESKSCMPCLPGSYSSGGTSECSLCPVTTYNPSMGSTSIKSCISCGVGKYNNMTGQGACRECETGTYNNMVGQESCFECPTGFYNIDTGGIFCNPCLPGTFSNLTKAATCEKCSPGTYNMNSASQDISECQSCPKGSFSAEPGSIMCYPCEPGTFSDKEGQVSCKNCTGGTYNPRIGASSSASCLKCPQGTYSNLESTECVSCPAGTFNNNTGSSDKSSCIECPNGSYSSERSSSCSLCLSGFYQQEGVTKDSNSCKPCNTGTFNSISGSYGTSSCVQCPQGTYNDRQGQASCLSCPAGTFNNKAGSSDKSSCIECPNGSYSSERSSSCFHCSPGFYQQEGVTKDSNSCKPCNIGTFNSIPGSYGNLSCVQCPQGTYNDIQGQASCVSCPAGTFNNKAGLVDKSSCIECSNGSYSSERSASCSLCLSGFYQQEGVTKDSNSCKPCNIGTFNSISGSYGTSSCVQCPQGTYNDRQGQVSCFSCPAGKFNEKTGLVDKSSCIECPNGSYSSERSSSCSLCLSGFYQQKGVTKDSNSCKPCNIGTFNSISGSYGNSSCAQCPQGTYNDIQGQASCFSCPAGTFNNKAGLVDKSSCIECPNGSYSSERSASCTSCDRFHTTPSIGSTSSNDCICQIGFQSSSTEGCVCPPGNFLEVSSCTTCQKGYYKEFAGNQLCTSCPTRSSTQSTGSIYPKDCICQSNYELFQGVCTCPPGYFENGNICSPCNFGSYKTGHDTGLCTPCLSKFTTISRNSTLSSDCICKSGYNYNTERNTCECKAGHFEKQDICYVCPQGTYNENIDQTVCRDCPPNSSTNSTGSVSIHDCKCVSSTYLDTKTKQCKNCPVGFLCDGSSQLNVAPGYWKAPTSNGEYIAYLCFNQESCIGGNNTCAEGYSGALCSVCEEGYGKTGDYCIKCPKQGINGFIVFLSIVIPLAFVFFMIEESRQPKTGYIEILKLLSNHFQVLSYLANFDVNWSSTIMSIMKIPALFFFSLSVDSYPIECQLKISVYDKVLYSMIMPLVLILINLLFIFGKTIWKVRMHNIKPTEVPFTELMHEYVSSIIVMLFFVHPSITSGVTNIFPCETLGDNSYLRTDMSIMCDGPSYLLWKNLAWAYVIVYSFGTLLIFVALMRYKSSSLRNSSTNTYRFLGFLVHGYTEKCQYWEVVIMMQKLAVVMISAFFSSSLQIYFGLCLLFLMIASTIYYNPFVSDNMKKSQLYSIYVLFFTLMTSLLFRYNGLDNKTETFLVSIVALLNGIVGFYFVSNAKIPLFISIFISIEGFFQYFTKKSEASFISGKRIRNLVRSDEYHEMRGQTEMGSLEDNVIISL